MVTNLFLNCNQCNTKYRIRWQVENHRTPLVLRCPECNSKITGYLEAGVDNPVVLFNATETDATSVDYVQEISTEFITHKLTASKDFSDYITPFMRSNIFDFPNIVQYMIFLQDHPNESEVIYDLYSCKSNKYLKKKLRDENNNYISICKKAIKNYKLNSEVDLLMAGHQYIMTMLLDSGIDKSSATIIDDLIDLRKSYTEQVKDFSKLMDVQGYYSNLNMKFPQLVGIYNNIYLSLMASLMIKDISEIDLNEFGLSCVDYEDLSNLYSKSYEFIGEFIIYIIGLNNIATRGNYNEFSRGIFDIEQKVNPEDKYNRIQSFVKDGERFSIGYTDTLNKIIRNADAHFDVKYDIFTQKITFINHGKKDTYIEELYLLEFALETIKIFGLAVKLWEIAYQLQKFRMIMDLHQEWNYGRL